MPNEDLFEGELFDEGLFGEDQNLTVPDLVWAGVFLAGSRSAQVFSAGSKLSSVFTAGTQVAQVGGEE